MIFIMAKNTHDNFLKNHYYLKSCIIIIHGDYVILKSFFK
jgi:hypothetical protein